MPIYKPSELRLFLNQLGISPRKGLSQNFLIDGNIVRKIVAASNVQPGDVVLEVGPGPGSLTQALLEAGACVVAVEKDQVLAQALEGQQTPDKRLHIYCEDIMDFKVEETLGLFLKEGQKAKIIANLPYHLTTPIIAQFVPLHSLFTSLIVMVQEEVGRRFTAVPNTSEYSSFTVFLEFYTQPKYEFGVSKQCFYPVPKVDSAVVSLTLKPPPLEEGSEGFFRMTRTAFEHRRKMLRASLRSLYDPKVISDALDAIGQNPLARPEALSLSDFLNLYKILRD